MHWLKQKSFFSFLGPIIFFVVLLLFLTLFFPRSLTFLSRPLIWLSIQLDNLPIFVSQNCLDQQTTLVSLTLDYTEFENLKIENTDLKKQLNFFDRESFSHITARIVNRAASPINETFVIDRGSDDGIKKDTAVIVSDGHMIGRVTKVYNKISIVQSLLGRSSKVTATVLNSSRTIGIIEGTGGALLSLNFVPQDQLLTINDLIVTSGLEENIPSGLIIGVVTSVTYDPAAPFQTATVEPIVDTRQTSMVSIIVLPSGI